MKKEIKNKNLEKKKKNYLLRGGIWGAGVYLILVIIFLLTGRNESLGFIIYFLSPGAYIVGGWGISANIKYLLQIITSTIFYFLLGSLIGWIYGKIKSRGGK